MPSEIKERWEKEINRARKAIAERKMVDSEGLIAEKALEIFHIPRSASEIDFLRLADEKNCLVEVLTAIYLMATREGEPRTGANLYAQGFGLLLWNPEWRAKVKAKAWALHQRLKTGCQDDLDFVIKLAFCFWKAEEKELAEKWADYHFVNYQVLKGALEDVKDLLDSYYRIEAEEETRNLNPQLLERVRSVMASAWPERIVNLKPGKPIIFPVVGKTKIGAVSRNCVGNWQEKKQAIAAVAVEEEAIIDGYPQIVPTASFMVQLPGQVKEEKLAGIFPKQISIEDLEEEKREIPNLGKKKGNTLEVEICQVMRDPVGKGGWIVARTQEGFEIPIELGEMSLSPSGPGLERIVGQTLTLTIKDFDEDGLPQLSNIDRVIEDIKTLRKEISEKNTFSGYVVEINEEEEIAIVVIQRENGVVHSFEIYKDFVPGKELSNLRIGEEVIITLSLPRTEKDHISADYLTKEEIDTIRLLPNGEYDKEKAEVSFSYCLENKDFKNWPARPETIEFVRRHSWQYCLVAKIKALKERLSQLKEMDEVKGVVQRINYEEDGKTIKSVQVLVEGNIPGFAFGSDLGSVSVSEGKKIVFYVEAVGPDSGFLRLVSKEAQEKKQQKFIERTQVHIQRWENNIVKARAAIKKIKKNIERNQGKLRTARSMEWKARFRTWIEDDERKIRDIERSIRDWLNKIESARDSLRQQKRK